MRVALALAAAMLLAMPARADDPAPVPVNAGTDTGRPLFAPPVRDGFSFVIFGDRTGGRPEGVKMLERAVEVTNPLDPDFVMTVGDLVQGYSAAPAWIEQVAEYKSIMSGLAMPWYPVVGNHDVYGGRDNPKGNAALYKEHVGPLYYSFDYRWAHFVCLFSDEALSFADPAKDQNLSAEQMAWLVKDLEGTKAKQVFVFLHHPRWLYQGTNWPKVHELFVKDGRVRGVFAGHLHQYRDDGVRDGIHYYVLAVTGAVPPAFPETAGLNHVHHVRVRPDAFSVTVMPLGAVLGANVVLGSEVDQMRALQSGAWLSVKGAIAVAPGNAAESEVRAVLVNPGDRPVAFDLSWKAPEGFTFSPATVAARLGPGERTEEVVRVRAAPLAGRLPEVRLSGTLHYPMVSGLLQPIHHKVLAPVRLTGLSASVTGPGAKNRVLVLDGKSAVRVDVPEGDGPFTLECWVRGSEPKGRGALLARTERSGYGIWWVYDEEPLPYGMVAVDDRPGGKGKGYVSVRAKAAWPFDRWTHVALSYDGRRARFFVGGRLVDEADAPGPRTENALPLYVGADPDARGDAGRFFEGAVDEVRLSSVSRYHEDFRPRRVHRRDADTLVLLHFDGEGTDYFADDSGADRHGWPAGLPRTQEEEVPAGG